MISGHLFLILQLLGIFLLLTKLKVFLLFKDWFIFFLFEHASLAFVWYLHISQVFHFHSLHDFLGQITYACLLLAFMFIIVHCLSHRLIQLIFASWTTSIHAASLFTTVHCSIDRLSFSLRVNNLLNIEMLSLFHRLVPTALFLKRDHLIYFRLLTVLNSIQTSAHLVLFVLALQN